MRERGRAAAMKRAEAQRVVNGGEPASPPAPARRGYTGGQGKYASAQAVHRPVNPGEPDTRPAQDGGRTIIKTARSGRKTAERTARQTIKTAEHSSRKAVKTAQRTAKTAQQTVKTAQRSAQATVKATQRAVQTARATAKAAAATAKATAKATVTAIKAAIAAMQELIAAIAAGGVGSDRCGAGDLHDRPAHRLALWHLLLGRRRLPGRGIPHCGDRPDQQRVRRQAVRPPDRGTYDRVEIQGGPPSWADVFAVFAAKTAGGADGAQVSVLDADTAEKLRVVFWDMTKITTAESEVEHPAEGDTAAWTEKVLTVTVTPRTPDDMRVFYAFTDRQNAALDELLTAATRDMWNNLLYGSSGEIVAVALSQVGNVGGQPYWSWYGFNSRVEWCACFVSWCANECGYIDAGVIPKFAGCTSGSNWVKDRGQWQDGGYEPRPGDLIFFDWNEKGSSGPQDDVPDHVGIVERVENGVVYTVEGNSSDSCRQRSYNVGHYEIWGYGCPIYN
ncbi:CHAP domain-containing protein [Pseudoflavonifractor sp. 524-17]|uniref:CHAP domain-containing protein n=1 Tax=Pseudoflavonifractor sp. 524-17 TaxID=2304577 RepID=UPI001FAB43B8|nr:CHAP domain-containing protein [Pseudoflavonifractor sp. 524-17]